MFRSLTPRQLAFDLILAVACFALRLVIGLDSLALLAVLVFMAAALALRRLSPGLALAVAWVGAAIQIGFGSNPDVCNLAVLAVLYTTGSYGGTRVKWAGLASSGVGALVAAVYFSLQEIWMCLLSSGTECVSTSGRHWGVTFVLFLLFSLTVLVLSWTLGMLARTWRKARMSDHATAEEQRRRIRAQRDFVVEQERNRIARDMHDVVAHSLAVVIAQADGARYARESDPDAVDAALATIASTSREALGDVRVLLAQLRHSEGEAPQPSLGDLDRLYGQFGSSGLNVRSETRGEPRTLPTGEQRAAYRIVQEALTNALRHGDAAAGAEVRFDWHEESLTVTISNRIAHGPAAPADETASGHGLVGMRERAMLWGGSLSAGPRDDGDFVVTAVLPLTQRSGVES